MPGKVYTESLAKLCREDPDKKYRPSNGSEGDMFQELWCENCVHDNAFGQPRGGCEILTKTMFLRVDEEGYPPEWNHDAEGQPQCTAFERIKKTRRPAPHRKAQQKRTL